MIEEQYVSFDTARMLKEAGFDVKPFHNYFISKDGRVFNMKGKEMRPYISNNGYYRIMLSINKERHHYGIHRLVAQLFIPNPNNYPIINHKDCNRLNNNANNLEWCTHSYNERYAYELGRKSSTWKGVKGKDNPLSIPIVCCDTGEVFNCLLEAATAKSISSMSGISANCKGKRQSVKGYVWRYYKPNETVKMLLEAGYDKYPKSFEKDEYYIYLLLAVRWLRDIHNIMIIPLYDDDMEKWYYVIDRVAKTSDIECKMSGSEYDSYEEAMEAGIVKCLELIKK